jgi:hypothetical protein
VREQRSLFDDFARLPVLPDVRHTRTAPADAIAPMKPNMLRQVREFVAARGKRGATDEEIACGLRMRESTARARRVELRDGGQVRDSLRRRRSRAGRLCVVWIHNGEALE